MFALSRVFARIVTAILAVFALMQVSTAVTAEPQPHRFLNMQTQGIWSSVPVRIERERQTFERLPTPPDPFPFKFRADGQFRALNSHQFKYKGAVYTLVGAPVIPRKAVCRKADGRRYACGLNAFRSLDSAMRGRFVECRLSNDRTLTPNAYCVNNGRVISDLLRV